MTISHLKKTVQDKYNVDLTEKSRLKHIVSAKRIFCYISITLFNNSVTKTGNAMGYNHDTAHYHNATGKDLVYLEDKKFIQEVYDLVNIDLTLDKRNERLLERLDYFTETLLNIPKGKEEEVRNRIDLMIKAYNFTHKDRCSVYEGEENLKEYAF
jgi:hypothetical protein